MFFFIKVLYYRKVYIVIKNLKFCEKIFKFCDKYIFYLIIFYVLLNDVLFLFYEVLIYVFY